MFIPTLLLASSLVFSSGVKAAPQTRALPDMNITNTYDPNFDLVGEYIVNAYINDLDTLQSYAETVVRPANAICYINKDGYMTDKNGVSFGETYRDIFGWYLKGNMIPIFYISDEETANDLISFYTETVRYDMGVMSTDPALLAKVKASCAPLHMVLDYSYKSDSELVLKDIVATSTTSGANTVVLSPSYATYDNMFYLHARLKTVWVNDENADEVEVLRQVCDGAYGCIVNNPVETINSIKAFTEKSVNKKYNYNRPIMNIGHRGLPQTMWENSLEGCRAAYQNGATHIEIDIQVTKDQKLAIMHDDTINRTTTGTGRISDYTAEELKQFRIVTTLSTKLSGEGVRIPMLDDIFNEFKGTSLVIVVEIKTSDINCVSLLKQYLEEADIKDQVIVISFYTAQLQKMKNQIPDIPCADLNSYTEGGFMNSLNMLGSYNMSINTNTGNYSAGLVHKMAERGYAAWFWTYDNLQILYDGIKKGVLGVTNNMADNLKNYPKKLAIDKSIEVKGSSFEDIKLEYPYKNYIGGVSEEKIEVTPIYIKENQEEGTAKVIFQGKYVSGTATPKLTLVLLSDVIDVKLVKSSSTSKGCGGDIVATNTILISLISMLGVLVIASKRRKHL